MELISGECIVITGAAGFTGRHACIHFRERGLKVTALVHHACQELTATEIDVIVCDLLDTSAVAAAMQQAKPDYVLHLAGFNSVTASRRYPIQAVQVNVLGTIHVLDALRVMPHVRALIITSRLKASLEKLRSPQHPYAFSKRMQEIATSAWLNMYGLDVMIAEPTNLIGPGISTGICSLIGQYVAQSERGWKERHLLLNDKQTKRDYMDVRDAVAAYEILLEHGEAGEVYAVQSGVERELGEIVQTFRRLALVDVPFRWQHEFNDIDKDAQQLHDIQSYVPLHEMDAKLMPKSWGFRPTRVFEHSVADILNYYRNEGEDMT